MGNRILILGKGYIGTRLQEDLQAPVSDKYIATLQDVQEEIKRYKPDTGCPSLRRMQQTPTH